MLTTAKIEKSDAPDCSRCPRALRCIASGYTPGFIKSPFSSLGIMVGWFPARGLIYRPELCPKEAFDGKEPEA